jgi:hypothetical protein
VVNDRRSRSFREGAIISPRGIETVDILVGVKWREELPSFAPSSAFSFLVIYQGSRSYFASFLVRYGVSIHVM